MATQTVFPRIEIAQKPEPCIVIVAVNKETKEKEIFHSWGQFFMWMKSTHMAQWDVTHN